MEFKDYARELLTKYHELELAKIKHPAFTVVGIWRAVDGHVCILVDDARAIKEVAPDGKFMGAEWIERKEWK